MPKAVLPSGAPTAPQQQATAPAAPVPTPRPAAPAAPRPPVPAPAAAAQRPSAPAPKPAAPAPKPPPKTVTAVAPEAPASDPATELPGLTLSTEEQSMVTTLRGMQVPEDQIISTIIAKRTRGTAPAVTQPAALRPAAPTTPVAAPKPAAAPKPTAPKPAAATPPPPVDNSAAPQTDEAPQMTDEEYARQLHENDQAQQSGHQPPAAGSDDDGPEADAPQQLVTANHWSEASGGALSGDIDQSDFKIPTLVIAQGNGPIATQFGMGRTVFMEMPLFEAPSQTYQPTASIVPVMLQKYYREEPRRDAAGKVLKDASGNEIKPRNASTKEQVQALGGTLEWTTNSANQRVKPTWAPAARLVMLIEKPANSEHPGFGIVVTDDAGNAREFGLAAMYVHGTAYREFAKPIIDATNFILKEGNRIVLWKRMWKMTIATMKVGENNPIVPTVMPLNELTCQMLREVAGDIAGQQTR